MAAKSPEVYLRIGSHAEKEYFEKMLKRFDGLIVGSNLIEATPGATASLLLKLCNESKGVPYLIDPMTYAFGEYVDPDSLKARRDLDWIKSDQKIRGQNGKTERKIKSSYQKLGDALETVFSAACASSQALTPAIIRQAQAEVCESVLEYQLTRIREVFSVDSEYSEFADGVSLPKALLAPYFYIEPSAADQWIELNLALAAESAAMRKGREVHAVLCAPRESLLDDAFLRKIAQELPKTQVGGVWLWFSKLDEQSARRQELNNLKTLVSSLSSSMKVYNLHGGYFSLSLSLYGLNGIAHGVGYGEQKDVVPIIGQSTPTVRYYLPALYARFGVPDIDRCFTQIGVKTPEDFFAKICDCVICRGVIGDDLSNFSEFGERHYSREDSKRLAQTPAAAKRCRFHFLLCRLRERDWIKGKSVGAVSSELGNNADKWASTLLRHQTERLRLWASMLT